MSRLANNPLFSDSSKIDVEEERRSLGLELDPSKPRKGRPKNEELIHENTKQHGLTPEWTRATFIVKVDLYEKLKDYAYTERISIKDAMDAALSEFLKDKDKLLKHR